MTRDDLTLFEQARPGLIGLGYRILGSRADADDVVQDCFVKWSETDRRTVDRPTTWLTTCTT
jgi:DNA-directed RNA polymerase specialized sigma24 family protein